MDILSPSWFSDLGVLEDPIFEDMDSFGEELAAALGGDFDSPESHSSSSTAAAATVEPPSPPPPPQNSDVERPIKQRKPNSNFDQAASASFILDFANSNIQAEQGLLGSSANPHDVYVCKDTILVSQVDDAKGRKGKKSSRRTRLPSQTHDHIIAERKRREQISQRFVALSAIVPGLKKMDKSSVLGDAIKYMKQLQERLKTLEEQARKETMESVVLVQKSQLLDEDDGSFAENSHSSSTDLLPEIEARTCGNSVLLRIHCKKCKQVLVEIISDIQNMNLTIVNMGVLPFGSLSLDITIIAEMEKEFDTTVKDIVRSLRSALHRLKQTT